MTPPDVHTERKQQLKDALQNLGIDFVIDFQHVDPQGIYQRVSQLALASLFHTHFVEPSVSLALFFLC